MVRWVVGSILHGGPIAISRSRQCSTTGVTKAVVSAKDDATLPLIGKSSPCGNSGFLSRYLNIPLPYADHINVNKNVLSASLNKTFPSFLHITVNKSVLIASLNKTFSSFLYMTVNKSVLIASLNKTFPSFLHF